jgi:hypothetical protein
MPDLLPRMALDPPPGYVAFVERHLEPLRRDAVRVVGEQCQPDELYPEVLTDVAARWGWLELLHTRLGRQRAADRYLSHAFARQSQRWRADQPLDNGSPVVDMQVWRSDADSADAYRWARQPEAPTPARTSAALRLAPQLVGSDDDKVAAIAEAAIAWLHAYEARRQRLIISGVVAIVVLLFAFFRLSAGL